MRMAEYSTAGRQYFGREVCRMLERKMAQYWGEDDPIFDRRTTEFLEEE
jgi:hypothetical protein